MLIRAFALNSNNKIELTLSELESLLNAAFEEGVERELNKKTFRWDYPYITCNTTNTLNKDTVTLNSTPDSISNLNSTSDKTHQATNRVFNDSSAYTTAMQDNSTYRNVNNGAINE